jgi:hypothetical protein
MSDAKDMSGVLFKNEKAETTKHPAYKGSALIGGAEYWISAWINTSKKDGSKYMALRFELKQEKQSAPAKKAAVAAEDIPF